MKEQELNNLKHDAYCWNLLKISATMNMPMNPLNLTEEQQNQYLVISVMSDVEKNMAEIMCNDGNAINVLHDAVISNKCFYNQKEGNL